MDDYEVIAQELSELGEKMRDLEERVTETERVNTRLEDAALTTARALSEVSRHWDAVYDAMRRPEREDRRPPRSATKLRAGRVARARGCPHPRIGEKRPVLLEQRSCRAFEPVEPTQQSESTDRVLDRTPPRSDPT